MIIAIDGPAASGKSSVARAVARKLDALFLNTGAMYRAVGAMALAAGVDLEDPEACGLVARQIDLSIDEQGRILLDGSPQEERLQCEASGAAASVVAAHGPVRKEMVARQQAMGEGRELVTEGRDTTTVVFPEAEHKFFLWASPRERARRRADQLGTPEAARDLEAEITLWDRRDMERPISPLKQAPGATRIDTDGMTLDQVIQLVLDVVRGA